MLMDSLDWVTSLRTYIADRRARHPLPGRADLSLAQEWQCRIVGGSLCTWLDRWGPGILEQRSVLHQAADVEENALVVFTSDVAGLVAAAEIIDAITAERVAYLLTREYEAWIGRHDDDFRYHLHTWSEFLVPPEKELLAQARGQFKLARGERFWQHSEGTLWAPQCGQGADHLWKWDGRQPELLAEAYGSRIY